MGVLTPMPPVPKTKNFEMSSRKCLAGNTKQWIDTSSHDWCQQWCTSDQSSIA
ncbi:hypothetical protein J6590_077412 [Homalodisca vitripennis]|nr:hypothetical protein J6590_077412 [Homalodisca vitripennis]